MQAIDLSSIQHLTNDLACAIIHTIQFITIYYMRKDPAMPYIEAKTNITLSKEKTDILKSKIAEALAAAFPGKTENWLMLNFVSNCNMYFGGSDKPCIMLDIAIFGSQSDASYNKMTSAVCELINRECAIPTERIYVKYSEYDHWGWMGNNF